MTPIDVTVPLAPLLYGVNALLVVSALAILAQPAGRVLRNWLRTRPRLRVAVHRPALGHR
jgi:hypothetical protein